MSAKPPIPDDLTREAMWDIILELRAELEAARAEIAELKTHDLGDRQRRRAQTQEELHQAL